MKKLLLMYMYTLANLCYADAVLSPYNITIRNTTYQPVYIRLEKKSRNRPSPDAWIQPGETKTWSSGDSALVDVYFDFPNPERNPGGHAVAYGCCQFKIIYPDSKGLFNWDKDFRRGYCY